MKAFIVLTVFAVIISCIKGSYGSLGTQTDFSSEIPKMVNRYCDLSVKNRKMLRFCLHENGVGVSTEFYRNCAQQLKFVYTFEEVDKYVCHPGMKLESLFFECFIPALSTLNNNSPKTFPLIEKCLSIEENAGFDAKEECDL